MRSSPRWVSPAILVLVGGASLCVGALLYTADRATTPPVLLPAAALLATGPLFGVLGEWLPSFIHPFAFSLLTAAASDRGSRPAYSACVFWWLVNVAFEAGQHPVLSGPIAHALHRAFGDSVPASVISGYFVHGTFDAGDIIAATVGALAAAGLMWHAHQLERRHAS